MSTIPWKRVRRGLAQFARQHGHSDAEVAKVMRVLPRVLALCGNASHSRKAAYRIAYALLQPRVPMIVPVCPDYSNEDGKYTYKGMSDGLPLLFLKHKPFVDQLVAILPQAQVTILLGDHEGQAQELRRVLGVTQSEFFSHIAGSLAAMRSICPAQWNVTSFSQMFPGFFEKTWQRAQELLRDSQMRKSVEWEATLREALYDQIGYPLETRLERTAHVVAQYLCLGEEVSRQNGLICNHSTTSLRWYIPTHVAVLHNPVKIY